MPTDRAEDMDRDMMLYLLRYWAVASFAIFGIATPAFSETKYFVYCANSKIEIDMRDPAQMKSARGSDVCMFGQFNFHTDAQNFARKNFGASGAWCSCR
jgi:hypothetical protein